MIRCVNIDWLEVYCLELQPHPVSYFQALAIPVQDRGYGTRVYNEMFTILDTEGQPFVEIRRSPKNPLTPPGACHIRLVNRSCYLTDAAALLSKFLDDHGFHYERVSRVDICLDFVRFDDGTLPRVFMQRYMRGKFSKVNQANIRAHGSDRWTGRVWNSVSWGSPASMVSTKFYNKTLELYDPKTDRYGKPHIRYAWLCAGLIDDFERCTLKGEVQEIWRIEFSIKSSVKGWFVIEREGRERNYQSVRNRLEMYDTPAKLLCIFASLAHHYFHFKRYLPDVRKDRCPDRVLFLWDDVQQFVDIDRTNDTLPSSRVHDTQLAVLIRKIKLLLDGFVPWNIRMKLEEVLKLLQTLAMKQELHQPHNPDEMLALQTLISRRQAGASAETYSQVLKEVKALLHLSDNFAPF